MRVKATNKGFDGSVIREKDAIFDIREFNVGKDGEPIKDEKGKPVPVFDPGWMVEVDAKNNPVTPVDKTPATPGAPGVPAAEVLGEPKRDGSETEESVEEPSHRKGGRTRKQ